MLQSFKFSGNNISSKSVQNYEPIHKNLFNIRFFYNVKCKPIFNEEDLTYIDDNVIEYDLHNGKILLRLNFQEHTSLKKFCDIFDNVYQTVIKIENRKGEIKRIITLSMCENSLDDFSFSQSLNKRDELVYFDVILKYKEILSEVIN